MENELTFPVWILVGHDRTLEWLVHLTMTNGEASVVVFPTKDAAERFASDGKYDRVPHEIETKKKFFALLKVLEKGGFTHVTLNPNFKT